MEQYQCQVEEIPAELSPEDIQGMVKYCRSREYEMLLERNTHLLPKTAKYIRRLVVFNYNHCKHRFMAIITYFSRLYQKIL